MSDPYTTSCSNSSWSTVRVDSFLPNDTSIEFSHVDMTAGLGGTLNLPAAGGVPFKVEFSPGVGSDIPIYDSRTAPVSDYYTLSSGDTLSITSASSNGGTVLLNGVQIFPPPSS